MFPVPRVVLSFIPPLMLLLIMGILWREKNHLSAVIPISFGIFFIALSRLLDVLLEYPLLTHWLPFNIAAEPIYSICNSVGDLGDAVGVFLLIQGFIQTIKLKMSGERHIENLETLLPICASCKKIRRHDNSWESIEDYLGHSGAPPLTHGICPDCKSSMMTTIEKRKLKKEWLAKNGNVPVNVA